MWHLKTIQFAGALSLTLVIAISGSATAAPETAPASPTTTKPAPPGRGAAQRSTAAPELTPHTTAVLRPGFNENVYGPNDDGTYPCVGPESGIPSGCTPSALPIGFPVNFFGHSYSSLYLNNNGNVTFDGPLGDFTPFPILTTSHVIIAPFFADVDTRVGPTVAFGNGTVDGHPAWGATWLGVGCFNETLVGTNAFQLVLINRDDTGAGNFDMEFNEGQIQWETGQASGGNGSCLGGSSARVGFSNGTNAAFELPGSDTPGSFLDSNTATGLIYGSIGSTVPGRYVFPARGGFAPTPGTVPLLPQPARLIDTRGNGGPIDTAQSRCFTVAGQAGIPANAVGVLMNVTAVSYLSMGWLSLYPAGQTLPSTSTLNFQPGAYAIANGVMTRIGDNGQVCVGVGTVNNAPGGANVVLDVTGYMTAASALQLPLLTQPQRLVDTRQNGGPIANGQSRCFTVAGQAGIPADATGVILNVAGVGYTSMGWLTLYPAGNAVPSTSTLNVDTHAYAIANGAIARIGTNGQLCVNFGTVGNTPAASDVVLDATGYLTSVAATQMPLLAQPQRLVDTRTSGGPINTGESRCFTLAGLGGVPSNAVGVVLNAAAVDYTAPGWVTLYPAGQAVPATSTLNFDLSEYAMANSAVIPLGPGGQVCASVGTLNSAPGSADVILDVGGYLTGVPGGAAATSSVHTPIGVPKPKIATK